MRLWACAGETCSYTPCPFSLISQHSLVRDLQTWKCSTQPLTTLSLSVYMRVKSVYIPKQGCPNPTAPVDATLSPKASLNSGHSSLAGIPKPVYKPVVRMATFAWETPFAISTIHCRMRVRAVTIQEGVRILHSAILSACNSAVSHFHDCLLASCLYSSPIAADWDTQDIVYNSGSGLWACCNKGSGSVGSLDCAQPTNQTFQAPGPEDLQRVSSITSSSTTSSALASSATASSLASTASTSAIVPPTTSPLVSADETIPTSCTSSGQCSRGLSNGAKAGISVGAVLAGLALIAASAFVVRRLRRRKNLDNVEKDFGGGMPPASASWDRPPIQELDAREQAELDSRVRAEMDAQGAGTQELDAREHAELVSTVEGETDARRAWHRRLHELR